LGRHYLAALGLGFRDYPVRLRLKDRVHTPNQGRGRLCRQPPSSPPPSLIGLPQQPAIVDVRTDEDYQADPRLVPSSIRRDFRAISEWAPRYRGKSVVAVCQKGQKLSEGTAAWLRQEDISAETLEGGFEGWKKSELLIRTDKMPPRDDEGRTLWVTRSRPKIDRIACPWLIRRFVDPNAVFLFVIASEVTGVAERFNATPFDIEGVYSHRGETCTFDTMVEEFGLRTEPLLRLAKIVRGADTARPDLEPECAGLLAASLGYSRMYREDLPQLEAAMALYDAFYRWCRDATGETHNWPSQKPSS
jgi:rhodanese-related sulfurtransferase